MLILGFAVKRYIHVVATVNNQAENFLYNIRVISPKNPFRMMILGSRGVMKCVVYKLSRIQTVTIRLIRGETVVIVKDVFADICRNFG